jgi:hypothetical protein
MLGINERKRPTMQRKTAIAAATAISMTVASATIAIGASFGALGFASSPAKPAKPIATYAVAAQSSTPNVATIATHTIERGQGEGSDA